MSYGGEIEDRALTDAEYYNGLFYHHDSKAFVLTFYGETQYALMLTPHKSDERYFCTGNNRHRIFSSKSERATFYRTMIALMDKYNIEHVSQVMDSGIFSPLRPVTDADLNDDAKDLPKE